MKFTLANYKFFMAANMILFGILGVGTAALIAVMLHLDHDQTLTLMISTGSLGALVPGYIGSFLYAAGHVDGDAERNVKEM